MAVKPSDSKQNRPSALLAASAAQQPQLRRLGDEIARLLDSLRPAIRILRVLRGKSTKLPLQALYRRLAAEAASHTARVSHAAEWMAGCFNGKGARVSTSALGFGTDKGTRACPQVARPPVLCLFSFGRSSERLGVAGLLTR